MRVEGGNVVTVNSAVVGEGRRLRKRGAVVSIVGVCVWSAMERCRGRCLYWRSAMAKLFLKQWWKQ